MRLNRKEILFFILISTLVLAWSSIPDWAGYAAQNNQVVFTGTYNDAGDYAVHIAMLRSGMNGAWGYNLRFTSEPHQTAYIRMFYIVLGEINRLFDLDPQTIFQIARWIFGYTALFSIYLLAKRTFDDSRWRWTAFFLIVFGSGLGWLQIMFGWIPGQVTPIDFWLIDCYVLFSLSLFPHFAFTLTLMCLACILYLDYLRSGNWLRILAIIAAALAVQFVNPIAFAVIDIAIAIMTLFDWIKKGRMQINGLIVLSIIAITQIPLLAYNFVLLSKDPIWNEFTVQNQTLSPPPIYYLWGFGLFWPFALVGAIRAIRERNMILLASLAWTISAFALAYAPFAIQRRFLLGITIPLGLLATRGLVDIFQFISQKNDWLARRIPSLTLLTGLLLSLTTLTFIPAQAVYMLGQPKDFFYPRVLDSAFEWLSIHTEPNDLILSATHTGQLLAQETGRRVYVGHTMETLGYATKIIEVKSFYQNESAPNWLTQIPVQWIVYGPYEQSLSPDFKPGASLELVFQNNSVQIYKKK